ncbi:hypothetical protein ACIBI4_22955 [Streptomyces sp. NPDC050418]|uniref:hypothetical protein n=1 Tax=Streptomyces sp. NPDC050418 TaxID=3365612 RepID=UPI0037A80B2D
MTVAADSVVTVHPLAIRASDDDPEVSVVGRTELGEFIELPTIGAEAIRLLADGLSITETERRIADEHDVEIDVAELAEALAELGFLAAVDGEALPDPAAGQPGSHLPWLKPRHVRWLFGRVALAVWAAALLAAVITWWRQPDRLMESGDFYWTSYVGLAVLVNTALFSVSLSVHELMHLAAARAHGAPARISFATRLHHLVVQTDVSAVWAAPRAARIRVYLAGLYWDTFVIFGCTLLVAYGGLPPLADRLLAALALVVMLSAFMQAQVYMRMDLYFVLMEWLRCGNLFEDGWAYARHLGLRACRRDSDDPTSALETRERRAVRVYAVVMAVSCAVALGVFVVFGAPIMIEGVVSAFSNVADGLRGGDIPLALDSAAIIVVEGGLQVLFLLTFYRLHRHWFRLRRRTDLKTG